MPLTIDAHYIHVQTMASTTWTVVHNLDKKPEVTIVDGSDNEVWADVNYIDDDSLSVTFTNATSGKVYCN